MEIEHFWRKKFPQLIFIYFEWISITNVRTIQCLLLIHKDTKTVSSFIKFHILPLNFEKCFLSFSIMSNNQHTLDRKPSIFFQNKWGGKDWEDNGRTDRKIYFTCSSSKSVFYALLSLPRHSRSFKAEASFFFGISEKPRQKVSETIPKRAREEGDRRAISLYWQDMSVWSVSYPALWASHC